MSNSDFESRFDGEASKIKGLKAGGFDFGLLDRRFLSSSIGLLNPSEPLTLEEEDTLGEALRLLKDNKSGCLVVVDETRRLKGIFSERDVLLKVDYSSFNPQTPLSELMTKEPRTVTMTTPIAYVLQLMSQGGFRHMPVVDDDGIPIGFVSVKNIVDYIVRSVTWDLESFSPGIPPK